VSPYVGDAKREYQRRWIANRRAEYLAGRTCVLCGAADDLEVDHLNAEHKASHKIWSWSRARLEAELAKCVVLCRGCHQERHALERRSHGAGGYKRGCRCDVCKGWKRESAARAERRRRESNPDNRLCRPTHSHSATTPNVPVVRSPNARKHGDSRDDRNHTGASVRSSERQ
jgi:hypothetical protein